ncbi:MAG TPA: protein kinase [Trebonia sp.]
MSAGPSTVLSGRYHLIESLGDGGMGSVWKAYDTRLERTVAVKELIGAAGGAETRQIQRERVRHEALALAKVEHPVIVTIHDLLYEGRDQDPWIVMAYVRGLSLDQIIRQSPPLDEREVARTGLAVIHGLLACHERGVYHRDVKPANIVRCEDGSVRLVDFGIARIAGENPLTTVDQVVGTLEFLAPELLNGQPAGPPTDLWALGVTLYYALAGQAPFAAASAGATIAAICGRNPRGPRADGALAPFVLRMLAKEARQRPDAATVAEVLRSIASTRSPSGPVPRLPRPDQAARTRVSTPLAGLPVTDAVRVVSDPANSRAAADLLALDPSRAASIISRCAEAAAGRLLSAIAADQPAVAWRLLDMLPQERGGRLLDHMSSLAAAAVLAVPGPGPALGLLARADGLTVVSALTEMTPAAAAALVTALDDDARAARLLFQTASPPAVAGILRRVEPAARGRALLSQLPAGYRQLVLRYLDRKPEPVT